MAQLILYCVLLVATLVALTSAEFSSSCPAQDPSPMIQIATYEEVKDLANHPEKVVLIDVREPHEVAAGKIPTSINIPLKTVMKALSDDTSNAEFKELYGRDKPTCSQEIIFTCRTGRRSQQAAESAIQLGYSNVKNYTGSWTEWAQKNGL